MPNIYDYIGFLKINNEESEIDYLLRVFDTPISDSCTQFISKNDDSIFVENDDLDELNPPFINTKIGIVRDLTGKKFGKLKVIGVDDEKTVQTHKVHWICECACGKVKSIYEYNLICEKSHSCGCGHSRNTYDLSNEDYGIGYTANGTRFLFDKDDYPMISKHSWHTDTEGYIIAKCKDENGKKKIIKMHRLIMGVTDPKTPVDHIHHNLADNRKSELRVVTNRENTYNRQLSRANTSGHTGIYYNDKRHGWRTYITANGKTIHLGYFATKEEAIKVREEAEKKYFGEHRYQGTITTDQILQSDNSN